MLLIFCLLFTFVSANNFACNTTGLSGCTSCTDPTYFILFNNVTNLYTCSNTPNCITVSGNDAASQCLLCQNNYFLFNTNCRLKNITNCANFTVDPNNLTICSACVLGFMDAINNCTVNANYCLSFDSVSNKCTSCPAGKVLDTVTSGYCVSSIPHCVIVSYDGCLLCEQQYIIDTVNQNTCKFSSEIAYQLSLSTAICSQVNFYYDSLQSKCVQNTGVGVNYCKQVLTTGSTNCSQCIEGYFLKTDGTCKSCKTTIQNCLTCSSCILPATCLATCTTCLSTHFLFTDPVTQGQTCRSCSTYGCKKCQLSSKNSISCLQCEKGQSLFNGTCYSCPVNFQLNLTTLQCKSCPSNCQYCSNGVCTLCITGYAIDSTQINNNLKCKLINSTIFTTSLPPVTVFQILSKQFPLQQNLIYNDSIQLMSSCQGQQSTKFSCLCNSTFTLMSSYCYNITTLVSGLNLSLVFGTTIDANTFLQNTGTVRLMAQVPTFDSLILNVQSVAGSLVYFTQDKIASLLQIYTQILRRQTPVLVLQSQSNRFLLNTTATLSQLFSLVSSSFSQSLSLTETTIIYGNGYYMKYYPKGANITDTDSTFISVSGRNESDFLFIFVYFDGQNGTTSLTGNVYAFSPLTSYQLTVNVQQTQSPSASSISYIVYKNNLQDTTVQVSTSSSALLSFSLSTSTTINPIGYNVKYQQSQVTDINSLYSSQRIEFIFYQPAFIYVLVFLVAYLFLIPCCSLVDFIDGSKGNKRKRVRSEDLSLSEEAKQNKKRNQDQQSSQTTIQITINYKDFFPMYNICNTPRPRRILKLCLFLLNTQHSITFLTLIYFNLDPGHPVVAVVLGVPAYFCTIIMAYIFGCFTLLKIPMWFKYGINLIAVGYWILWVSLMPRFKSQEYQPYVYIFAIVFFVIDMLVDLLEMFMVYFTIKQSDRQMKMFQCLAAWLSKRGYYEYDKLARELND